MDILILPFILVFCLLATTIGRGFRSFMGPRELGKAEALLLDTAFGVGFVSLVFFATSAGHLLRYLNFVWIVAVSTFGASHIRSVVGDCWSLVRDGVRSRRSGMSVVVRAVLLLVAVAAVIPALAPPSASDWDSLAYHLSVPKLYLEHGGFYYIDFMSHSNFPMLVEMLYLPALSVDSPAGAKMVHYLYGVLLVLSVVMLVRKHFTPKGVPLAALAVAGIPIVMWEATTAYIDLATTLYTVVAVYLLLDYFDNAELRSLVWCGVAAGFAASTKMTGLTLIPMLAAWLVVDRWLAVAALRRRQAMTEAGNYGRVAWHSLLLAGVALLVCSPWYIKSWIYTGNPVYPFFYSVFGGQEWTLELAQHYRTLQHKFGVGHDFASFAFLPWDLTFRSERFYDTPGLYIGPILLVAVPLLFAARGLSRKLIGLIGFFLAQMVIWFVLTQQSRYLIPAFAILAVIVAAIAYSEERFRVTRIALYAVFGATALFGVLVMLPAVRDAWPVVSGEETTDRYLSRTLPIYEAEKWLNENAPVRSKVALFGDTRGFYLDRDYVWADWGHNTRFTRRFDSVDEFVSYLKAQGITHALVNFRFLPEPDDATGTARWVYQAIDDGRFEQVRVDGSSSIGLFVVK